MFCCCAKEDLADDGNSSGEKVADDEAVAGRARSAGRHLRDGMLLAIGDLACAAFRGADRRPAR